MHCEFCGPEETPPSVGEVKAQALREAADDIDDALFDGISVKQVDNVAVFSSWLRARADELERQ